MDVIPTPLTLGSVWSLPGPLPSCLSSQVRFLVRAASSAHGSAPSSKERPWGAALCLQYQGPLLASLALPSPGVGSPPNIAPGVLVSKKLIGSQAESANSGEPEELLCHFPFSPSQCTLCSAFPLCPGAPEETGELKHPAGRPVQNTLPFSARILRVPMSRKWPAGPSWPAVWDPRLCWPGPPYLLA